MKDIKRHSIGRQLMELQIGCWFGADLIFYETDKSKVERAALYGMAEVTRTSRDASALDSSKADCGVLKVEMSSEHLVVRG